LLALKEAQIMSGTGAVSFPHPSRSRVPENIRTVVKTGGKCRLNAGMRAGKRNMIG